MRNSIIEIRHTAASDEAAFAEKVMCNINELQNKGLSVEVQYHSAATTDELPYIAYSALIIGRKESRGNCYL